MRGKHNVHLLCKENKVVSFKDKLNAVHKYGRINLTILFLTTQHLLLQLTHDGYVKILKSKWINEELRMLSLKFVSLNEVSILLNH